jgi:hypothetical protein
MIWRAIGISWAMRLTGWRSNQNARRLIGGDDEATSQRPLSNKCKAERRLQ